MSFPTPVELLKHLETHEVVDPIVKQLCKLLAKALLDTFSVTDLLTQKTIHVVVSSNINTPMEEVKPVTEIITKHISNVCTKSDWTISDASTNIGQSQQNTSTTNIEFKAQFSVNFDLTKKRSL